MHLEDYSAETYDQALAPAGFARTCYHPVRLVACRDRGASTSATELPPDQE